MAEKNLEKADENLRYATLGFEEGVIPASNVLEAHTAWLSAQSEKDRCTDRREADGNLSEESNGKSEYRELKTEIINYNNGYKITKQ